MNTSESDAIKAELNSSVLRLNQSLRSLLESVPGVLWAIENKLNSDGECTPYDCKQYIDEVHACRMSMSKLRAQWENASGNTLDQKLTFELDHFEFAAVKLIEKVKNRLFEITKVIGTPNPPGAVGGAFETQIQKQTKSIVRPKNTTPRETQVDEHVSDQGSVPVSHDIATPMAAIPPEEYHTEDYPHEEWIPPGTMSHYAKNLITAESEKEEGVSIKTKSAAKAGSQNASISSAKLQLQADLQLNSINQKYLVKQTERDMRAATRAMEEVEERATQQAELLQKEQEELRVRLETLENSERGSAKSSVIAGSGKVSSKLKTRAFVDSIASHETFRGGRSSSKPKSNLVGTANEETLVKYPYPPSSENLPKYKPARPVDNPFQHPCPPNTEHSAKRRSAPSADNRFQKDVHVYKPTTSSDPTTQFELSGSNPRTSNPNRSEAFTRPKHSVGVRPPTDTFRATPDYTHFHTDNDNRFSEMSSRHVIPLSSTPAGGKDKLNSSERVIETVCAQMALSRLPILEPQVFTGQDPLLFPVWKISFDTLVHHKAINDNEKLHFLSRYVGGEARKAIQGFFLLSTGAYRKSYETLVNRYGDQFKIANSFRQRLKAWTRIGSTDSSALREFIDFLHQCETAMVSLPALAVLNDEYENTEIVRKLPSWLSRKWVAIVASHRVVEGYFPTFKTFVEFLSLEDQVANDPMALTLQGDSGRDNRKSTGRGGSFTVGGSQAPRPPAPGRDFGACSFCENNHSIHNCDLFKRKSFVERQEIIRECRLCFGCLNRGHMLRDCRNPIRCTICRGPHPPVMHKEPDMTTTSATTYVGHNSNRGPMRKSSMIVPVFISDCDDPDREVLTYAMLDTQSDTSFVTEKTAIALDIKGKETRLLLSTMTSSGRPVTCRRYRGLRVRGVRSQEYVSLPALFSRNFIPANRDHIPRIDMVNEWPHLEKIKDFLAPEMECEIGLLLGYDCPKALEPSKIIRAPKGKNGPFGMETVLGWGIVGIISYSANFQTDSVGLSHRILAVPDTGSHIITPTRIKEINSPQECLRLLEADFRDDNHNEESTSLNDRRFLKIMEEGITVDQSGNYSLPLPFNARKAELFDNQRLVMNRVISFRRKLDSDPIYRKEYCSFMNDMFERGFAEKVKESEVARREGIWYIPHFRVYHKVKKKIRVVFDCSAQYGGVSLNDTFFKGRVSQLPPGATKMAANAKRLKSQRCGINQRRGHFQERLVPRQSGRGLPLQRRSHSSCQTEDRHTSTRWSHKGAGDWKCHSSPHPQTGIVASK